MTVLLILLLIFASLLLGYLALALEDRKAQTRLLWQRLEQEKHNARHYQGFCQDYKQIGTDAVRALEDSNRTYEQLLRPYLARLDVLEQHPKVNAKQLRRILNAHAKRQYRAKALLPGASSREVAVYYQEAWAQQRRMAKQYPSLWPIKSTYPARAKEYRLLCPTLP